MMSGIRGGSGGEGGAADGAGLAASDASERAGSLSHETQISAAKTGSVDESLMFASES
jgi:hypothetical protein